MPPVFVKNVEECRDYLERGWILAYPTETTYGLGVNPLNKEAVELLDKVKKRNRSKQYLMLVKSIDMLSVYAELSDDVKEFLESVYPSSVSVVLKAKKKLPEWLLNEDGTVCFRIAIGKFVKQLFEYYDRPLISTSANPESLPIAKGAEEVLAYFQNCDRLAIAPDLFDDIKGDIPSTIIDFTKPQPVVIRQGSFKVAF
jgi:L-threonylcarbamoyladenylate synthase